jgi:hypothetical protein
VVHLIVQLFLGEILVNDELPSFERIFTRKAERDLKVVDDWDG